MNDNTNKQAVVAAIWDNPARAFGCEFRQSGRYWENRRGGEYDEHGKIRLLLVGDGANIAVFYNGASRPEKCDVFTYLGDYVLNTGGFRETLERCAEIYGITLQYTAEEREVIQRQRLAAEVAPSLIEALRSNPDGVAGRYLTERRGLTIDDHFGELTEASIERAAEGLRLRGKTYTPADFEALGLTVERARYGYNLVLPYYRNGNVVGFLFRNTNANADYIKGPKYLFSEGLSRGGYCDRLTTGEPAVIVEGEIDAIRLAQAGIKNVVGMGAAQMTEGTARLLRSRNIEQVTYVPDLEYNEKGEQRTDLTQRAVDAFLSAKIDGEPVVKNLYMAELYADKDADLRLLKVDADSFGKEHGPDTLAEAVELAVPFWSWEIDRLLDWARAKEKTDGSVNIAAFQTKFDAIYSKCANTYERERIKQYVDSTDNREVFRAFGVTPQALNDRDEWNRGRDYNNRVKAAAADLAEAVEKGANPATVGAIVAKLADAQSTNTRDEWDKQLAETFADELDAIRNQPETLRTKWELGNIGKDPDGNLKYYKYEQVEFWPADISVFCAPTSHGKTMILFQSALDLVQATDKTYIFVSCEENKRQLVERALNVYIDIPNTPNGKTADGDFCFISGTRKRTIKAIIRGATPPTEYAPFFDKSEHFDKLAEQVRRRIDRYGREVRPRLKFVHTDATAESITANVLHTVDDLRASGVEVGAVFVDYMQLLTSDNKSFSRHDELKDVCKALKGCAARLEIPVVIAAQLNRDSIRDGIDAVTVVNIGEGADIERIAHDIYLVWQVDKTKRDNYFKYVYPKIEGTNKNNYNAEPVQVWDVDKIGDRSRRIFYRNELHPREHELKRGFIYVEQMKARDGKTEGWGLFPFDGERGYIGEMDKAKMAE